MPATSNVDSIDPVSHDQVVVSQDVFNFSFSAASPVAMCIEHTPDKDSYVSQTGDLEIPLGSSAAAAGAPLGDISLTEMEFRDLEGTIRFFEKLVLGIPDSFLDSLPAVIVISREFDFVIGGNSLADSLDSFHSLIDNSGDPIQVPPRDGIVCRASFVNLWVLPARRLLWLWAPAVCVWAMGLGPWGFRLGFLPSSPRLLFSSLLGSSSSSFLFQCFCSSFSSCHLPCFSCRSCSSSCLLFCSPSFFIC